ncbi:MAG TPA: hypothetical protein VFC00_40715 [Micromonosporaceae bacterium]|nr:hypothetical protein [Micromonosporaceae bacterium]
MCTFPLEALVIKARGIVGGRRLLLLGLSGENVTRLMAGEPIRFDGAPYGFDGQVVIVGGRTEEAIVAELERHGLIDSTTERGEGGTTSA